MKGVRSQIVRKSIGSQIIRKCRIQRELKNILPYKFKKHTNKMTSADDITKFNRKVYSTVKFKDSRLLQQFYDDDAVSKICPGKKDVVKRVKVYKQRRILLDSLKNLYSKFVADHGPKLSYTTFTRVRPFWVQPPNSRDRE